MIPAPEGNAGGGGCSSRCGEGQKRELGHTGLKRLTPGGGPQDPCPDPCYPILIGETDIPCHLPRPGGDVEDHLPAPHGFAFLVEHANGRRDSYRGPHRRLLVCPGKCLQGSWDGRRAGVQVATGKKSQ